MSFSDVSVEAATVASKREERMAEKAFILARENDFDEKLLIPNCAVPCVFIEIQ